ncbi:RagB/SusD family nutrient uptake outer membrane protein [Sphingobacterium bovistauri]|uniref:RagB/SusD family nutrient uptake outer membrane protein n=1 Tax=Sphingobacterium bovistauri TaxID=2781959 RepID=A0ABS7ZAI2_9SPHI|nr:RagB/SusD family nutrient uptake outer membrane protein [Sphingobacterium bovistauri]MCA5005714.1 RagB/SusD family nutrient uptake outer membrane protein [Sphingobacterium bovistauri]
MKNLKYLAFAALISFSSCSKDFLSDGFLEKDPLDQLSDPAFWSSENNIRTYTFGFYNSYFKGYGKNNTWGNYFSGQGLNDDFAPLKPVEFTINVPTSGGGWSGTVSNLPTSASTPFGRIRKANQFIASVPLANMAEEAKNHWSGIGRFFRALEYANFVNTFGDVPYIDKVLSESDAELYRKRDSRTYVMDKVLEDFQFAAANVRANDGTAKLSVNKYVVLAYMSRVFLFEGTWLKYHDIDQARAKTYLEAAKWAAEEVIKAGVYNVSGDYRAVFSSLDLTSNAEVILFKRYEAGLLTHALMSNNNLESQSGISKSAIESYLASDGLPIAISATYKGDKGIENVVANRDGRLNGTVVPALRLQGVVTNYSSSGYSTLKFLNEQFKNDQMGTSFVNTTDAPIIRYGEVLVNYAEACAELGIITQDDLDKSINKLRARAGVNLPKLEIVSGQPAVNGKVYDDPNRDQSVSSLIWEIRRERRSELIFEGFRLNDLRRWKKLEYADADKNPSINLGAYIDKTKWTADQLKTIILNPEGYIVPSIVGRTVVDKHYLEPIPLDQIALYKANGSELNQNPGW